MYDIVADIENYDVVMKSEFRRLIDTMLAMNLGEMAEIPLKLYSQVSQAQSYAQKESGNGGLKFTRRKNHPSGQALFYLVRTA